MGGCFGNSPVDRYLENQLYRQLDEEDRYSAQIEIKINKGLNLLKRIKQWNVNATAKKINAERQK